MQKTGDGSPEILWTISLPSSKIAVFNFNGKYAKINHVLLSLCLKNGLQQFG